MIPNSTKPGVGFWLLIANKVRLLDVSSDASRTIQSVRLQCGWHRPKQRRIAARVGRDERVRRENGGSRGVTGGRAKRYDRNGRSISRLDPRDRRWLDGNGGLRVARFGVARPTGVESDTLSQESE